MRSKDFNIKWRHRLEEGHYGAAINDTEVLEKIDKYFTKWEQQYPTFTYSQIKYKFSYLRVYVENIPNEEIKELYTE
jgi:hypothetical protein